MFLSFLLVFYIVPVLLLRTALQMSSHAIFWHIALVFVRTSSRSPTHWTETKRSSSTFPIHIVPHTPFSTCISLYSDDKTVFPVLVKSILTRRVSFVVVKRIFLHTFLHLRKNGSLFRLRLPFLTHYLTHESIKAYFMKTFVFLLAFHIRPSRVYLSHNS